MKYRKAIAYAYPSSTRASELGYGRVGCYYVEQSLLREDGTWSPPFVAHGCHDGFSSKAAPELLALFAEADGDICPHYAASLVRS